MKSVFINEYGSRDKLIIGDVPQPVPQEGEVLVRIQAAGVNPVDWKIREGRLKERMPNHFPITLGWDFAGVVVDRGHSARRFEPGSKVFACCRRTTIHHGAYAEYIAIPESYLARCPYFSTFEEAAAVPLASLTAYQCLVTAGHMHTNEKVLIVGASGGVGSMAVQIAKIHGAVVYAVASRANHEYLKSIGADHVIDYRETDFVGGFLAMEPKGADLVFACVGGESLIKSYNCVRPNGRCLTIVERGDAAAALEKNFRLHYVFVEPHSLQLEQMRTWIDAGRIKITLQQVLELDDAVRAHELIEAGHTRGKIVLKCG